MTPGRVRFTLALALVLLLEALCRLGIIGRFSMIPPSEILWHLGRILLSAQMWPAILKTLTNVVAACVASILVIITMTRTVCLLRTIPPSHSVDEPSLKGFVPSRVWIARSQSRAV